MIVTDTDSLEIGMALWDAAEEFPNKSMIMMETRTMHGEEPTPLAAAMMKADVIFRATKFSLSHSHARRDACAAGADYYASIKGHKLFPQHGMVRNPGETCSPPDIEMASGAIPGTAHGEIAVDGSITHPAMGISILLQRKTDCSLITPAVPSV